MKNTVTISEFIEMQPTKRNANRIYKHVITPDRVVAEWDKMLAEGKSPSAASVAKRLNVINPATGKLISRQQIWNLLKQADSKRFGKISRRKPHMRQDKPTIIIREIAPTGWQSIFPDAEVMLLRDVSNSKSLLLEGRRLALGKAAVPPSILCKFRKFYYIDEGVVSAYEVKPCPVRK